MEKSCNLTISVSNGTWLWHTGPEKKKLWFRSCRDQGSTFVKGPINYNCKKVVATVNCSLQRL